MAPNKRRDLKGNSKL